MSLRRWLPGVLAACILAAVCPTADAKGPASANLAGELASLMTQQKLDAFAIQDSEVPGRFTAVLLIPDVQLLVVSADYPAPADLAALLAQKHYRDVYAALHQPASAPSRFFLLDLGCDGVHGGKGDEVDVLYEKGVTQTLFNGDWKSQALSESAYQSKVTETERAYSEILRRLQDALRGSPPAVPTTVGATNGS